MATEALQSKSEDRKRHAIDAHTIRKCNISAGDATTASVQPTDENHEFKTVPYELVVSVRVESQGKK